MIRQFMNLQVGEGGDDGFTIEGGAIQSKIGA